MYIKVDIYIKDNDFNIILKEIMITNFKYFRNNELLQ